MIDENAHLLEPGALDAANALADAVEQKTTPGAIGKGARHAFAHAITLGRRQERAAIVAWLLGGIRGKTRARDIVGGACESLAESIERAEHMP